MSTVASPRQEQSPTTAGIPKRWAWARVEDILVPGSPVVYGILQPGPDTPGGIPYIRPTEIDGDVIQVNELRRTVPVIAAKYKRSEVRAGDVILTIVGTIGKVAIVPDGLDGANITQSSSRLRADSRVLSSRYLAWTMRSPALRGQFDKLRLGTAVPRLNIAHVRDLLVPIAPLPEQDRIVAKIEELFSDLDAGVAALERVRANLKRYRAAVLKAAVEGRLTEEWRTRHPVTEPAAKLLERILAERRAKWEQDQLRKFKDAGKTPPKGWKEKYRDGVPPADRFDHLLPNAWTVASVDQLCPVFVDCAHRTPKYSTEGVPALRPRDVVDGMLRLESAARVSDGEFAIQTARRVPEPGDIIYSRELSCGWGVLVPQDTRLCMSQGMVLFRPSGDIVDRFLLLVVNGPVGREQAMAGATGSAHPHINLDTIRGLIVPVPPLAEQAEIVAEVDRRLSVADAAETQVEHALQRAARLRQAILKRAFEGKLVPQDPTDEPAAKLLERTSAATNGPRAVIETSGTPRRDTPKRRSRARA